MSKMNVTKEELDVKDILLPVEVEKEVNGVLKMVPIEYLAEITSAKEEVSKKSGEGMLVVAFAIDALEGRVYIDHYLSYSKKAIWQLAAVVKVLELNAEALDTDDFLAQKVWVTIKHDTYTSEKKKDADGNPMVYTQNKIDAILRKATEDEKTPF